MALSHKLIDVQIYFEANEYPEFVQLISVWEISREQKVQTFTRKSLGVKLVAFFLARVRRKWLLDKNPSETLGGKLGTRLAQLSQKKGLDWLDELFKYSSFRDIIEVNPGGKSVKNNSKILSGSQIRLFVSGIEFTDSLEAIEHVCSGCESSLEKKLKMIPVADLNWKQGWLDLLSHKASLKVPPESNNPQNENDSFPAQIEAPTVTTPSSLTLAEIEWVGTPESDHLYNQYRDTTLIHFYQLKEQRSGPMGLYQLQKPWEPQFIAVVCSDDSVGWQIPLSLTALRATTGWSFNDSITPDESLTKLISETKNHFSPLFERLVARKKLRADDFAQCRLLSVETVRSESVRQVDLKMSFGKTTYGQWRFGGAGVLSDEIRIELYRSAQKSPDRKPVIQDVCENLHWRQRIIPNLDSFTAYQKREVLGGIQMVTVLQDPSETLDLFVSQRPSTVGDNPSCWQALPRGFHQPPEGQVVTDWSSCACLQKTVVKEFAEEMLGVDIHGMRKGYSETQVQNALRAVQNILIRHSQIYITGLCFGLDTGNYELSLLMILDSDFTNSANEFYRQYPFVVQPDKGTHFVPNFESLNLHHVQFAEANLKEMFSQQSWVPGTQFAISEAARVLRNLNFI